LAEIEEQHVVQIAARGASLAARPRESTLADWRSAPVFQEDEARDAQVSAYRALAFAVRNEERAFAFYTYVAAEAVDVAVRALAEDLARDELDHASRLRRLRRRAFRENRPLDVETPTSLDELRAAYRQWESDAAAAHDLLADRLNAAGQTRQAEIFQRLADEENRAAAGVRATSAQPLSTTAAGMRLVETIFDRLSFIGERAKDEFVVGEAQRLAQRMVARMALAGSALRGEAADA
jgi:rubrerythrin